MLDPIRNQRLDGVVMQSHRHHAQNRRQAAVVEQEVDALGCKPRAANGWMPGRRLEGFRLNETVPGEIRDVGDPLRRVALVAKPQLLNRYHGREALQQRFEDLALYITVDRCGIGHEFVSPLMGAHIDATANTGAVA